jgi:hypothetical protein
MWCLWIDSEDVFDATAAAEELCEVEHLRLQALVDGRMAVAADLHADDYQLISPGGRTLSKDEYLAGVESGELDYHVFEAASAIAVRVFHEAGVVRYQARIEIAFSGQFDSGLFWHTDFYERRDGRWQAVWSQATRIPH